MSRVYKYIFNESRILRRLVCHSNDTDTIANWLWSLKTSTGSDVKAFVYQAMFCLIPYLIDDRVHGILWYSGVFRGISEDSEDHFANSAGVFVVLRSGDFGFPGFPGAGFPGAGAGGGGMVTLSLCMLMFRSACRALGVACAWLVVMSVVIQKQASDTMLYRRVCRLNTWSLHG